MKTRLPLFFILWAILQSLPGFAQKRDTPNAPNFVKMNVTSIPLSNFSFQYERAFTNKISGAIGLRIMPKSELPLKSIIEDLIDDEEAWRYVNETKISNFAITPEIRFYLSKRELRGFYIAPFVRFASYTVEMPFEYDFSEFELGENDPNASLSNESSIIPLDGKISSITAGFMLGSQFKIAKMVYLDWWILGPHYGNASGSIKGEKDLSQMEQYALNNDLEGLNDLPFIEGYEVNGNGANIQVKGPWGGVRAGLNIGVRF